MDDDGGGRLLYRRGDGGNPADSISHPHLTGYLLTPATSPPSLSLSLSLSLLPAPFDFYPPSTPPTPPLAVPGVVVYQP